MTPKVTLDHYSLRIHFGEHLHLIVKPIGKLLAVHAWKDSAVSYTIEYVLEGGSVVTQYDDAAKFTAILKQLDEVL